MVISSGMTLAHASSARKLMREKPSLTLLLSSDLLPGLTMAEPKQKAKGRQVH